MCVLSIVKPRYRHYCEKGVLIHQAKSSVKTNSMSLCIIGRRLVVYKYGNTSNDEHPEVFALYLIILSDTG